MRRLIVALSLLTMLGVVVGLGATRKRPEMADAAETAGAADAGDAADAEADAAAVDDGAPKPDLPPQEAPPEPAKLRVVASSWEVLAPGVLANGGMKPGEGSQFTAAALDVTFSAAAQTADIEVALGSGGDAGGADVALMPLPTFVASYERLRALSPQVFFVVAWSRGRDALTGDVSLLRAPPAKGNVKLVGRPGSAESLLGLFALDRAGVGSVRVDVVPPGGPPPKKSLQSMRRRQSRAVDAREVLLSTAEATHLIPIVAIAPKGVVSDKRDALVRFSRVWLAGTRDLDSDPAAAARQLAGQPGAPKAVDLIDALGWVRFADLHEAAASVGLSGRRASTLDSLFSRTWTLWRASGLIATPPPEHAPLSAVVIAELAAEAPGVPPPRPKVDTTPIGDDVEPLLVHRVVGDKLSPEEETALVAEVGFLADVFARSRIRIWVRRDDDATRRIISSAASRFGQDPERFVVRSQLRKRRGAAAVVEVLPVL